MGDPVSKSNLAALALYRGDKSYFELGHGTFGQAVLPNPKTGADPCELWCRQPVERLREYCQVIKIHMFWPLLFAREGTSFLEDYGLLFPGWNLKGISEFQVLEELADLIKKVVNIPHFISGILRIGSGIENGFFHLGEALDWIRCVGDAKILQSLEEFGDLGQVELQILFTEWKRSIIKVALEDCDLVEELRALTCESSRKDSEFMKQRGNDEFSRRALGSAIISYTKAIELCPTNHLLYGNRALCFILTKQYERAVLDGKRAILLKPDWPKGHHHFCKALSLLGKQELALEANERAQELCKDIPEGLKELVQQHHKLKKEVEELNGTKQHKQKAKKALLERKDCSSSKSHLITSQQQKELEKDSKRTQFDPKGPPKHDPKGAGTQRTQSKVATLDSPQTQSHQNKRRPKPKPGDSEKMRDHLDLKREAKAMEDKGFSAVPQVDFSALPEDVTALARDGCTALMEQQCQSAERAFSQLLSILYSSEFRCLNIRNINYAIIIYGHATALLGIGQPEALARAEHQFKKIIEDYPEERCFCLAHYGIGKVFLKQNRFAHALDQFLRSKLMIDFKIVPGVLTWPATTRVIEETRVESLQMALRSCIEECRFPPEPDAVCRYQHCHGHSKIQIFLTDPDFKGFIRVLCCQRCRVEFHLSCWKKLKTIRYSDKNDKDFLKELCFTPDCKGLISKIVIFSSSGLVKCEFEQKITKAKEPPRANIKQKCSSIRKLKMKQEKKARRKRAREEARSRARRKAEEKQEGSAQCPYSQHSGHGQDLHAGDWVLQHISRNSQHIQTALGDTAKLLKELLSWGVITEEDYTSYSQSSTSQGVMEQLLSSLMQQKSRVKTRGFIHVLSELQDVDPKLHKWLKHLNNLGLTATKNFLLQHRQLLQELDYSILSPLWNQKYGRKFDYVTTPCEKPEMCDYFLKPPLEKTRCFIWLLEDNREHFPCLHQALDEFFDKMDDPTIILKKQGNENISSNDIKVKNKNRKKNLKDSKSILVLSSGVSTAPREEEKRFIEENTLYRDFTNEPFVIPEYLREQLEQFEALYEASNRDNYNIPDPVSESLYEYFSLILEEHGPLEMNNKLLIGEYETFPAETRQVVEDQGGLECFLLKSPLFILVDNLLGLKKHSVLLEANSAPTADGDGQDTHSQAKLRLNPNAEEFRPLTQPTPPHQAPAMALTSPPPHCVPSSLPAPCRTSHSLPRGAVDSVGNEDSPFPGVFQLQDWDSTSPAVLLSQLPWAYPYGRGYPYGRILPGPSAVLGYVCGDPAAPWDRQEAAIPRGKCAWGGSIPAESQTHPRWCHGESSGNTLQKKDLAAPRGSGEEEGGKQLVELGKGSRGKAGTRSNPSVRMVAVQVNQEVADRETNTLPFQPFENQEGDVLRVEKEHQVLKEQLKEAEEKFQQLQSRSLEETGALEELLKKSVEETEVSQNELDWFHQDSEAQMKKWQQEKKEARDNLKALRSTVKKHTDTNERYLKTIEDKEKQYNVYLNTFLDTSNKFANEKVKLEELIKKSQDDCQECVKRAVKAEMSVLQNWKETEVWRLSGTIAKAETNLRILKALSSSASAAPVLKSQIDSWQTFISNVKQQLEKVEAEYEEKIELVRSGARISLGKVENVDVPSPPSGFTIPARPSISDPAIVTYFLASAQPSSVPAFSSPEGQAPAQPSLQTGAQAAHVTAGKTHPKAAQGSQPDKLPPPGPAGLSGSNAQPKQNHQAASALQPRPPALPNHKKLPKALETIIAQLQSVFPNYSSSDFTGFIREVQKRNGNTLAGLSLDEVLNRVTELILDLQSQASPAPSAGRAAAPPAHTGTRSWEVPAEGNAPSPPQAEAVPKNTSTKNPPQPNLQPWGNVGAAPKAKWKKQDNAASSEDPCTICHDELSRDSCELECGHHFHRECIRTWLKEHSSTCPICRVHALLPEDFPELPAWNKYT